MKLLGLDIGDRRIGLAFGDSELRMATPLNVVERASFEQVAREISAFAKNYDAERLVVGMPRNMDGTMGAQGDSVKSFAEQIASVLKLQIVFWDERLTTVEATERVHANGNRRPAKKSRRGLDAIAASVILQDYLDSQRSTAE